MSVKHYQRELSLLEQTTKAGKLLDVGCSVGGFVKAASELGYTAEGIDISAASVAVGQAAGLKIRAEDASNSSFPDNFDVIYLWRRSSIYPSRNRYLARKRIVAAGRCPGGFGSELQWSHTALDFGNKERYVGPDPLNLQDCPWVAAYLARFGFEILHTVTRSALTPLRLSRTGEVG